MDTIYKPTYEDVKLMTESQRENFFLFLRKQEDKKYKKAVKLLIDNKDDIMNAYYNLEMEMIDGYDEKERHIDNLEELYNNKECFCGERMRFIKGQYGDFWGCPNYKDQTIEHVKYDSNYEFRLMNRRSWNKIKIDHHWCTDILKRLKLHTRIRAIHLMRFFIENDVEDLREKYGYKSTMDILGNIAHTSKRAKDQEKRVFDLLSNTFDNVVSQQGISFREKGSYKKQYRFIDFIASNDDFLFVIEVKLNAHSIDLEQISEYWELMSDIVRPKERPNRFRTMATVFIVDGESTDNTVSFDELKNLNGNLREIEDLLINKSIMFDPI